MNEICGDNRFEIIAKAKAHLLEATNIDTSEDEMKVLDNFLFRCWQMGWLDRYDRKTEPSDDWICTTCKHHKDSTEERAVECRECGDGGHYERKEQTEPQTENPCDGCVCDDGKHLMYCMNCKGIAWKTEPPQTEREGE